MCHIHLITVRGGVPGDGGAVGLDVVDVHLVDGAVETQHVNSDGSQD